MNAIKLAVGLVLCFGATAQAQIFGKRIVQNSYQQCPPGGCVQAVPQNITIINQRVNPVGHIIQGMAASLPRNRPLPAPVLPGHYSIVEPIYWVPQPVVSRQCTCVQCNCCNACSGKR